MKTFRFLALSALALTACSSADEQNNAQVSEPAEVTLTFSPYEVSPITRTATSISGLVTMLDVWLYESGSEVSSIHQTNNDADFGSVSVNLDKTKTYTIYAVGHKCAEPATITDGIISFPDDKVTHSLYYTTTFSPSTTTVLSCLMYRIVAMFRLETTDPVPSDVKTMRFTVSDVFDRWSVTNGCTHQLDRVSSVSITSTASDGTVAISVYVVASDAQTLHTVTVDALDASGAVIQSRIFTDVPLRNGYKSIYRGSFFTDTQMSLTFTADDWQQFDTFTF